MCFCIHMMCVYIRGDPSFTQKSQSSHQLYIRGRHYMISTITTTRVYKAVSPIIRKNGLRGQKMISIVHSNHFSDQEYLSQNSEITALINKTGH